MTTSSGLAAEGAALAPAALLIRRRSADVGPADCARRWTQVPEVIRSLGEHLGTMMSQMVDRVSKQVCEVHVRSEARIPPRRIVHRASPIACAGAIETGEHEWQLCEF